MFLAPPCVKAHRLDTHSCAGTGLSEKMNFLILWCGFCNKVSQETPQCLMAAQFLWEKGQYQANSKQPAASCRTLGLWLNNCQIGEGNWCACIIWTWRFPPLIPANSETTFKKHLKTNRLTHNFRNLNGKSKSVCRGFTFFQTNKGLHHRWSLFFPMLIPVHHKIKATFCVVDVDTESCLNQLSSSLQST